MTVSAQYLLSDGRTRKKVWRGLVAGGYIEAGEKDGEGTVTQKAFDEIPSPVDVFDLAALYTFDAWDDSKQNGEAWVTWDRLNTYQKAFVIRAMRADPTSFQFVAYSRFDENHQQTAGLGECGKAMEAVGGMHDAVLAITNEAVKEKRRLAARTDYAKQVAEQGLTHFLQGVGVIEKEDALPMCEKQPFLGSGPALSRNPNDWPNSLPVVIQTTKDKIQGLRAKLALFEKMAEYVETVGGWEKFIADYNHAVERHVAGVFDKK